MSHPALRPTPIELFLCAFFGLLAFLDNFRLRHLDYCNLRGSDDFLFDSRNGNDQFSGICDHPDPFAEFQITDMYSLSDEEIADTHRNVARNLVGETFDLDLPDTELQYSLVSFYPDGLTGRYDMHRDFDRFGCRYRLKVNMKQIAHNGIFLVILYDHHFGLVIEIKVNKDLLSCGLADEL